MSDSVQPERSVQVEARESPAHSDSRRHLSNTTAKRRSVAHALLSELKGLADKHEADLIAGDFKMAAFRGHGKPSSIEEARGEGRGEGRHFCLRRPRWFQRGVKSKNLVIAAVFITTNKEQGRGWRLHRHGSIRRNKKGFPNKHINQAAHLSVFMHCSGPFRSKRSGEQNENAPRR